MKLVGSFLSEKRQLRGQAVSNPFGPHLNMSPIYTTSHIGFLFLFKMLNVDFICYYYVCDMCVQGH